ncbi:hypothetical protein A2V54_01965 [candidate division WWE3 bacterium RBG_19FT_COMBO_53_11]|uniref:VWFA domain-containing protein n=1 Tax=candidate division WWE3 bacterium RBG_19FT_COMBO_53_11 TaxID=1802613 RepID=A0A1F4UHW7_UNCKA|nr:MAG: hypothetical protein A2V54_01965 [candidate division WWE3 bacterium RBG_19FT_COMBO_53_11]
MFPPVTFNQPLVARIAPLVFLALLLLGLLVKRNQRRLLTRFGLVETLRGFSQIGVGRWGTVLLAAAVAFTLLAAAEPAFKHGTNTTGRTLNAVVVLDISRSMLAEDAPEGESRSDLARAAVARLFNAYPQGYFGIVTVARSSQSYTLTDDHSALRILLDYNGNPYRARDEGSDLPGALLAASEMIEKSEIPVDLVIFVSDGGGPEINRELYRRPFDSLSEMGVRVVSAGVGGMKPVPIPARDRGGNLQGYHSKNGVLAVTSRNDIVLRFLAEESDGVYLVIEEANDLVEAVRAHNLATQSVLQGGEISLVYIPLLATLLCLLLFLWSNRRFDKG